MNKEVILTGLRSNSQFHLGNYLGAILPMVELQKKHAGQYQINMFVPDLHSFTTPVDHSKMYQQSIDNLKVYAAAGLDLNQPDTFIYRQSFIPAHSELTWILDCFVYIGELSRMTQLRDKVEKRNKEVHSDIQRMTHVEGFPDAEALAETQYITRAGQVLSLGETASVGLFNYPVLMAADILLYGAKWIPVGDDQRQHVEFTRDLAIRMNNKFGDLFIVPEDNTKQMEFTGRSQPVRVRSLRNPDKKMSKSVEDPAGTILLSDNPEEAANKVMSATTDSEGSIHFDFSKQPGISNLLQILALLTSKSQKEVNAEWEGKSSYGELKEATAAVVSKFLTDLQSSIGQVDETLLLQKLETSESEMSKVAGSTLLTVQRAVGLRSNG